MAGGLPRVELGDEPPYGPGVGSHSEDLPVGTDEDRAALVLAHPRRVARLHSISPLDWFHYSESIVYS